MCTKANMIAAKIAAANAASAAGMICAKCGKRVYPVERIQCLDKLWHKACFRCTICSNQLTMNTYKGFEKMPYCSVHYPTQKHTLVPDTPEMKRLTKATELQSNVRYQKGFVHSKGKKNIFERSTCLTKPFEMETTAGSIAFNRSDELSYRPLQRKRQDSFEDRTSSSHSNGTTFVTTSIDSCQNTRKCTVQAMYDYQACEPDELSFKQGDIMYDCEFFDPGWMIGTHARTKATGMLPANYVMKLM